MTNDNARPRTFSRSDFYRLCREWHGYLSAFAFVALIFFCATGILLNHPGLLQSAPPALKETIFELTKGEIATLRAAAEPGVALARIAGAKTELVGVYRSGEMAGDDVYASMQGVRGRSDVTANLASGKAEVHVEREGPVGVLNGLHRGEHAGEGWRLFSDIIAVVLIVMSVIGVVLFLSMRFRLRTALVLMTTGFIVMAGLFVFAAT
jgi:hypothetical protein